MCSRFLSRVCVCVCVCEREREREGEIDGVILLNSVFQVKKVSSRLVIWHLLGVGQRGSKEKRQEGGFLLNLIQGISSPSPWGPLKGKPFSHLSLSSPVGDLLSARDHFFFLNLCHYLHSAKETKVKGTIATSRAFGTPNPYPQSAG